MKKKGRQEETERDKRKRRRERKREGKETMYRCTGGAYNAGGTEGRKGGRGHFHSFSSF
jgi:hypothetical protein